MELMRDFVCLWAIIPCMILSLIKKKISKGYGNAFLLVHKVIGIKEEEFNKEREELSSKIDELSKEYGELEKKHNNVMDSIRGIINE